VCWVSLRARSPDSWQSPRRPGSWDPRRPHVLSGGRGGVLLRGNLIETCGWAMTTHSIHFGCMASAESLGTADRRIRQRGNQWDARLGCRTAVGVGATVIYGFAASVIILKVSTGRWPARH